MGNGVDTDTSELQASIDASAEQELAMSAQFGSQAENVMNQLNVGAQERREEFQETILSDAHAPMEADAIAALTEDYDTILSGVQREMSLAQQATIRNIEQQQAATQNYMEMLGAALPALEARLQAQVEAAGRAGSSGGRASAPPSPSMLFGDPNLNPMAGYPTGTLEREDYDPSVENPYREYWGMERTDAEKEALAKELGIDVKKLFPDHGYETFADATLRDPDREKWFFMTIAKEFGYEREELQQAYQDIWKSSTILSSTPGESQFPHWFLNKSVAMFTSFVSDGMDPKIAHEHVLSTVLGEMNKQYANEEMKHEPEVFNQWVKDLEFLMSVQYNGLLHANNMPMDYTVSGLPGDLESVYQVGDRVTALDDAENYGTPDWDPNEEWYGDKDTQSVNEARNRELDFIKTREEVADDPLLEYEPEGYGKYQEPVYPKPEPDLMSVMAGVDKAEEWWETTGQYKAEVKQDPLQQRRPTYDIPSADYLGIGDEVADQALRDAVAETGNVDWSGIGEGYKLAPKGPTDSPYQIKQADIAATAPTKIQESTIDFSAPEIGDAIAAMQAQTSLLGRMQMPDYEKSNATLAAFLQEKERQAELARLQSQGENLAPAPDTKTVKTRRPATALQAAEWAKGFRIT